MFLGGIFILIHKEITQKIQTFKVTCENYRTKHATTLFFPFALLP